MIMTVTSWTPRLTPDGSRPRLHVLGHRIFVAYGTGTRWVAELRVGLVNDQPGLVPVREFRIPVTGAGGGSWTDPGVLTFYAGGDRWTLDVRVDPLAPTLEAKGQPILAEEAGSVEWRHIVPYFDQWVAAVSDELGRLHVQVLL